MSDFEYCLKKAENPMMLPIEQKLVGTNSLQKKFKQQLKADAVLPMVVMGYLEVQVCPKFQRHQLKMHRFLGATWRMKNHPGRGWPRLILEL